jgi:hypothetical protein
MNGGRTEGTNNVACRYCCKLGAGLPFRRKLDVFPVSFHLKFLANLDVSIFEPFLVARPMDQFVEDRGLPDDPAIAVLVLVGHLAVDENRIFAFVPSVSSANHSAIDLN